MIKQTITFPVPPKVVYDILMDEKKHSEFTGASAEIDPTVGGEFCAWNCYAVGKNIELIPGKKIVQSWHAVDWPEDAISTITYHLTKTSDGCKLEFTQKDVPTKFEKDVENGWKQYYWEPLKEYIKKNY